VGWVLGGAGVLGLGVGTAFGVIAIGDKSAANCTSNVCDHGTVNGIKTSALVSDIGWISGGVLLATGAALVLFAPKDSRAPNVGLELAPTVTTRGGGFAAAALW
jgi:hypothetical protein